MCVSIAQRSNADVWQSERNDLLAANSRLHDERMELRAALEEERARFQEVATMKDSLRPELARMRTELGQTSGIARYVHAALTVLMVFLALVDYSCALCHIYSSVYV